MYQAESKWILFSRTFWINVVLIGIFSLIVSEGEANRVADLFRDPDFVMVIAMGTGSGNILARYFTSGQVSLLPGFERHISESRTFRINLIMAVPTYLYLYEQSKINDLSLPAMIVLGLIPLTNIFVRIYFTDKKTTLLPGPLGSIL